MFMGFTICTQLESRQGELDNALTHVEKALKSNPS